MQNHSRLKFLLSSGVIHPGEEEETFRIENLDKCIF